MPVVRTFAVDWRHCFTGLASGRPLKHNLRSSYVCRGAHDDKSMSGAVPNPLVQVFGRQGLI
jgi:hypothetical protein